MAVLAALTILTLVLPNVRDDRARPDLQHVAAYLRGSRLAGALRLVRLRSDRAAPRLFPSGRRQRRGGARAAALRTDRSRQRRPAARRAGRGCGPCQILTPTVETGVASARRAESRRGDRHRGAGAAARRSGRAQGGPGQPVADQPEPGVGVGAREHRPDHPGGRGSFRSCLDSPSSSGWTPRTRCCWR